MVNMTAKRQVQCLSLLLFMTCTLQQIPAADYVTIIGPDGRPLVVPINNKKVPAPVIAKAVPAKQVPEKAVATSPLQSNTVKNTAAIPPIIPAVDLSAVAVPQNTTQPKQAISPSSNSKTAITPTPVSFNATDTAQAKLAVTQDSQHMNSTAAVQSLKAADASQVQDQNQPVQSTAAAQVNDSQAATDSAFSNIDGQQYVNNEYLEDKEFNLEGKKRFYIMPEGVNSNSASGGRLETIEREKGVNVSFLNQLFKPEASNTLALALSDQYFRMSKTEVEQALEQRCFSGKKFKKPKKIDQDGVLELVATPPIKDIFDYELVKIESPIENIKLTSYSASDRVQKYYWPLVVFLNEKGCIIEAAGGFKTQQLTATMRQHSAIEGLITLPQQTRFMLMTPLASAIDVDESALTNQGQIKLMAIR